ncbi:hypothetical protein GOP47_0003720 [Adiantum capillus-veneris]|uniref:TF-B3 domain-containing protein n=1 Tax=Adiantum capillus-veneris TaxID=13818 RepID=A0A9D4V6U2_ADICA|nr:hypothetical protein GOP47_0003720 [Adiantum capillus-veneris]
MEALSSSSLPSAIADFPASPALGNSSENDGCESEALATTVKRTDSHEYLPSFSLDRVDPMSGASNMPETPLDYISEDLELDVMTPREAASCDHQHDSCSDDMSALRLDELLQADIQQEFVEESNLSCVDDLFPSSESLEQEFCALDSMYAWSLESLRGLEAFQFHEDKLSQAGPASYDGEDESASQMFGRWIQSNAHWISLSDLRKIKLKTSTIESATRRLGGGKKGLMLFLKFVLLWVQNSRLKPSAQLSSDGQLGASLVSECLGPSAINDAPRRPLGVADNLTNSFSPLMVGTPPCPDWMTRARWGQPLLVDHSGAPPIANSHAYGRNDGSPLSSTDFCHSNSAWLNHNNILRAGVSPSSLSASGNGSNVGQGVCLGKDVTNMMMLMQQQHCPDTNPAATTRAARKSRMERQRWSVRHNRRWSATAHQNRLMSTASARANLPCWSQVLENGSQGFLHSSARSSQQQRMGGRSSSELQQNHKRPEKNLRLLFQKELKQSDVGNLGRIVLPKAAETCLPPLESRDGLNLLVEDLNSSKVWNMRYRFWPNNKSRMYLLENTSDFVKSYDLKEGDYMMLFCDIPTGKFVIRGAKGPMQAAALCVVDDGSVKKRRSSVQEEADCIRMSTTNSENSCEDSLLAELIEQSLEDMKDEVCTWNVARGVLEYQPFFTTNL